MENMINDVKVDIKLHPKLQIAVDRINSGTQMSLLLDTRHACARWTTRERNSSPT
jgi:hypothetical protein